MNRIQLRTRCHVAASATLALLLILSFRLSTDEALANDRKLQAPEIEQVLVGQTFDGVLADGKVMRLFSDTTGGVEAMFEGGLRTGEWRISGDAFCARWDFLNPDTWGCYNVVRQGDAVVALQRMNGTVQAIGRVLPGNVVEAPLE